MKSVGRFILLGGLAMLLSACGTVGFDKKSAQVDSVPCKIYAQDDAIVWVK